MRTQTKNMVLSALFLTLGIVTPIIFHMFGLAGEIFLPMHIPVILCGFICGWKYGGACGILTPLLSCLLTGMPPLFPIAVGMMFELCAYGVLSGLLYKKFKVFKNSIIHVYVTLIAAMLGGRIVMGIANTILFDVKGIPYGFQAFLTGAFVTAIFGIVLQLVLVPAIVIALKRAGIIQKS